MSDFEDESGPNTQYTEEPNTSPDEAGGQTEDPVEEALYTSFMQAQATGADASQAFNVGIYSAKQVALDHGIPEMVFEQIASDMFAPYSEALGEGMSPQEALRFALQTLDK